MKTKIYLKAMLVMALSGGFVSCNDYLDKEPLSSVSPELYFNMESHLQAYTDARYADVLPSWGKLELRHVWSRSPHRQYGLFELGRKIRARKMEDRHE